MYKIIKTLTAIVIIITISVADVAINTDNFPDINFRSYISGLVGWRNVITTEEIAKTTLINVSGKNISNLKGIEYFTALDSLICSNNQLKKIDISNNKVMRRLDCSYNQIEEIDVSKNTALTNLVIYNNQIKEIDLSKNLALFGFSCVSNQLTSLDLSNNHYLEYFYCSDNQLISIDLSKKSIAGFSGDNQKPTITLSGINDNYAFDIELNNPTGLKTGLLYYNSRLRSTDKTITESDFSVKTGNGAHQLSGKINFKYVCNHIFTILGTKTSDANCTSAAKHNAKCIGCGVEDASNKLDGMPAFGHNFTEFGYKINDANCITPAKYKAKCSRCAVEHENLLLNGEAKFGHNFTGIGDLVNMATCITPAQHAVICKRCSVEHESNLFPAGNPLGHEFNALGTIKVPATCVTASIHTAKCNRCTVEAEGIDLTGKPLGHDLSKLGIIIVSPTCVMPAQHATKCSQCEFEDENKISEGDVLDPESEECKSVSIINNQTNNEKYGIKFAKNIVSDKAEISIILPQNEKVLNTKIVIYDMTGNIVFNTQTNNGNISWNLLNKNGKFVTNGIYLVIAEVKNMNGIVYTYSAKLGVNKITL